MDALVFRQMGVGIIPEIAEGNLDAQVGAFLYIISALYEHGDQSGADLHPVDRNLISFYDKEVVKVCKADIGEIAVPEYGL